MVAQAIFPLRDSGTFKHENTAPGSNDVFQALLRDYGTQDLNPRDDTARADRSRDRVQRDARRVERDTERVDTAWRRFDASREVRAEDRHSDSRNEPPRNERPEDGDIPVTEPSARRGTPDESQPRAERPDRDVEPATVTDRTQEHISAPIDAEAPLENELGGEAVPKLEIPVIDVQSVLAGNPALAAPPAIQIADAAIAKLIPASHPDTLGTAPRPAVTPNGGAVPPVLSETENSALAAPAAAKAIQNILPAVSAEAGNPLIGEQVKRSQAPGQKASVADELNVALKSAGTPGKEDQVPDVARLRNDRAGLKTAASGPAPVTDAAVQAETKQATRTIPVPVSPTRENPGQGTPVAGDTTAGSLKAATPAANAGQAPAGAAGIDPMQTAARVAGASPGTATDRPVPVKEVAVHIQRAVAKGENRIRIQLHPAELGQVDVRLKIGADGIVRAMVQVERPETLDLMQRDARGLERALQDAGLKTDSGSLSFNLRDNGENGPQDRDNDGAPLDGHDQSDAKTLAASEAETQLPTGESNRALDIRV